MATIEVTLTIQPDASAGNDCFLSAANPNTNNGGGA